MNHEEQLIKIRQRTVDALKIGMVDESHYGLYQTTLIQLLNECERGRQSQQSAVENLKRQIAVAEGQMHAYSMMGGMIYSVLDGLVKLAEKAAKEITERKAERTKLEQDAAEREQHVRAAAPPTPAVESEPELEPDPALVEPALASEAVESSPPSPSPPTDPAPRRGVVRRPKP